VSPEEVVVDDEDEEVELVVGVPPVPVPLLLVVPPQTFVVGMQRW
jgi:hypothetical protein